MDLTLIKDKEFEEKLNISIELINILKEPNILLLRKKINQSKEKIIVLGDDELLNRQIAENKKVDILLSPEINKPRDFFKSRNSGLNQIICKLLNKNNITVAFSFSLILNANSEEKASLLGKMQQNAKLCKKYKVKIKIATFAKNKWELRNQDALKSFGKILGLNDLDIKKALD